MIAGMQWDKYYIYVIEVLFSLSMWVVSSYSKNAQLLTPFLQTNNLAILSVAGNHRHFNSSVKLNQSLTLDFKNIIYDCVKLLNKPKLTKQCNAMSQDLEVKVTLAMNSVVQFL